MKEKGTAALLIASMPKKGAPKGKEEPYESDEDDDGSAMEAVASEMLAAIAKKDAKALAAALRDAKDC